MARPNQDFTAHIFFRVPPPVKKEFRERAKERELTISELARELVSTFLRFESTKEKLDAS